MPVAKKPFTSVVGSVAFAVLLGLAVPAPLAPPTPSTPVTFPTPPSPGTPDPQGGFEWGKG
jgi:hypothetical protein